MTMTLQLVFLCSSIAILFFVIYKVRKSQLQINDAIIWIIGALCLIVMSVIPDFIMKIANMLGFYSASNFILSLFVFFLLLLVFIQSIKISVLNDKLKNLNHYIALKEKQQPSEKHRGDSYEN